MQKKFYKTKDIAEKLGMSAQTVIMWCKRGVIKHSRGPTGTGRIRIPISEGDRIIKEYFVEE